MSCVLFCVLLPIVSILRAALGLGGRERQDSERTRGVRGGGRQDDGTGVWDA